MPLLYFFILLTLHINNVYAQTETETVIQNKIETDKSVTNQENASVPLPETEVKNIATSADNQTNNSRPNQGKVVERYDIFPKSQIENTITPIFKREAFGVNSVFKSNPQEFQSPETYGGTNSQFYTKPKSFNKKNIPKELRDLFKTEPSSASQGE